MERRRNVTMRMLPDVYHYAKQLAKMNNRPFSNLVEYLLLQEIERARDEGIEFEKYVPEGGNVEGVAGEKDNSLDNVFKKFTDD